MANYPNLEALSGELTTLASHAGLWTVAVQGGRGPNSSGVLWDHEHVLTAELGLSEEAVEVGLPDGRTVSASVLGRMPGLDLALLRLAEPVSTEAPPWSDDPPSPGLVVSLGREHRGSMITSIGMLNSVEGGLAHRSAFGPAFAGGPIVDCRGSFLGLNVHGRPPKAVPYKKLKQVVAELRQGRSIEPGYLGLGLLALEQGGCLVVKVESGSPAEKARIMLGDQVLSIEGQPINGPEEAQRELRSMPAGRLVTISLQRAGQPMDLQVQLGSPPQRSFPGPGRQFFRAVRQIIRQHGPHHQHAGPHHHGPHHHHPGPPHRGPEGAPPPFAPLPEQGGTDIC